MTREVKNCNNCKLELPLSSFYKNRNTRLGQCKDCCARKEKEYRATTKGATAKRNATLLRKYNIDYSSYEDMFNKQKGICLICRCDIALFGDKSTVSHVDHCHITGKVRGLLCNYCNSVLGVYGEDIKIFQRAIDYLKEHNEQL
jgi:hypothetical protein